MTWAERAKRIAYWWEWEAGDTCEEEHAAKIEDAIREAVADERVAGEHIATALRARLAALEEAGERMIASLARGKHWRLWETALYTEPWFEEYQLARAAWRQARDGGKE